MIPSSLPTMELKLPWKTIVVTEGDPCFSSADYEKEIFDRVSKEIWGERPTFVDIGAHQGIWATFLAHLAGPRGLVYALEPHPDNYPLLAWNTVPDDHSAPVCTLPFAIGSEDGVVGLRCWQYQRGMFASTGMHQLIVGQKADYEIPVPVRKLDSLSLGPVDLIKMDVEHWEVEVIKGAEKTVREYRPRLMVEIHSKENAIAIAAWCKAEGFTCEKILAEFELIDHAGLYLYIKT